MRESRATSGNGDVVLHLTNLHGDIAATIDTGLTEVRLFDCDEFGVPADGQADLRYGWLGGKQRSGEAMGDVILMGVRLYSPGIGRFLQTDPIVGGNATAYDYCFGDPVNCTDLDGKWSWKRAKKWGKWALNNGIVRGIAVGVVVGAACVGTLGIGCAIGVGVAAGAALGGANWYVNHRRQSWGKHVLRGALEGGFGGARAYGAAKYASKYAYRARHSKSFGFSIRSHQRVGRYTAAKRKFSASNTWAAKTIYRGIKGRYYGWR